MSEHVYKIIELVGSSKTGIEEAVNNALSREKQSVRNSRWFEITQLRGEIENDRVAYWQVALKIGFAVEERSAQPKPAAEAKKEPAGKTKLSGRYRCTVCGYIYDPAKGDPDNGVKPGTAFAQIPDSWTCPECGVSKDQFEPIEEK